MPDITKTTLPTVVREGKIRLLPDLEITVLHLSDGQRIIPEEDFHKFLNFLEDNGATTIEGEVKNG